MSNAKKPEEKFDYDSIKPGALKGKEKPAERWQRENGKALADATSDAALAAVLASDESAAALVAKVAPAYLGEPLALAQIAAVSQFTMRPGTKPEIRERWISALFARAESSKDTYVKQFCLDQLRWCADKRHASRVRALGAAARKPVREFAAVVARELERDCIGL